MQKKHPILVVASLAITLGGPVASAADLPQTVQVSSESGWTFTVAPYLWLAGVQGDIGQLGLPKVEVDATFADVIKNFDIGGMVVGEARYGRFGLATDFQYIKLAADADTPHGVLSNEVEVESETLTAMVAGSFRLIEDPTVSFDVLAGARLWSVSSDIHLNGGLADGTSFDDSAMWVDPIVGAKMRADLSENIYLTAWGMVGGFGVSSDFAWDVMGALGYSFHDSFAVVAGYRAVGVDYENGDFVFDVVQHGPIVGGVLRF